MVWRYNSSPTKRKNPSINITDFLLKPSILPTLPCPSEASCYCILQDVSLTKIKWSFLSYWKWLFLSEERQDSLHTWSLAPSCSAWRTATITHFFFKTSTEIQPGNLPKTYSLETEKCLLISTVLKGGNTTDLWDHQDLLLLSWWDSMGGDVASFNDLH